LRRLQVVQVDVKIGFEFINLQLIVGGQRAFLLPPPPQLPNFSGPRSTVWACIAFCAAVISLTMARLISGPFGLSADHAAGEIGRAAKEGDQTKNCRAASTIAYRMTH